MPMIGLPTYDAGKWPIARSEERCWNVVSSLPSNQAALRSCIEVASYGVRLDQPRAAPASGLRAPRPWPGGRIAAAATSVVPSSAIIAQSTWW